MLRILVAIVMLVVIYCEASGVCPWSAPNIMCIRQGDRECEADDQVQYFLLYLGSGPEEGEVLKNTGGLSFVCLSVRLSVRPPGPLRPEICPLRPEICPPRP